MGWGNDGVFFGTPENLHPRKTNTDFLNINGLEDVGNLLKESLFLGDMLVFGVVTF